ncbi:restriction endonuclease subunit S [Streptococcus suis]|uniref:restriction endonuclease subunit S n=1 Tax=Streptococcus suis TaxID=1307 RepID=UPI00195FD1F9|nr:restriction endonuclease subunit S [Streptococcus suis]MBM7153127.1 restriction endonuclease subunit S [Streptococcus suis]MDG4502920.1 restriction endonuclease subunit S [Streptococcus suis]
MNYIEKMLQDYCPNRVEWKELGEVLDYEQPTKYIVNSKDYNEEYPIPVLTAGQTFILGYTDETEGVYAASKEKPIIIFDDFTTASKWVDFEFKVKSSAMKILTIQNEQVSKVLIRYVWHYLGTITYKPAQHGRQWIGTYSKIKIPIPPLKIQEEIVQILDKFTEYVTELTAELTAELTDRQKQYSFYRDKLLSFEDEVYQVEWKTLGELFEFKNGLNKGKEFFGRGTPIVNYTDVYKNIRLTSAVVRGTVEASPEEQKRYNVRRGDVFFTRTSETKEEIGKTSVLLEDIDGGVFSGFVLRARPKTDSLLPEYCAHCFNSSSFRKEIVRYSTYTTRALTNGSTLAKLTIPLPPLPIQERIVQVLDNFDAVCNDLSIGLPKEIELRQKQYEYFREKLLTFTAEGVYPGQWTVDSEWGPSDLIRLLQWVFGTIRVELGAIATVQRGASPRPISSYLTGDKDGIPWIKIGDTLSNSKYITSAEQKISQVGAKKSRLLKKGDFILSNSMSYGRPYILQIDGAIHDGWASISDFEETINPDFLYQYLSSQRVQSYWDSKINSGSVSNLNSGIIKSLEINLPSLSTQKRIVAILDKFDELTNSISQGLPKEIELRQKQYEYFRDTLLNFPNKYD